MSERGKQRLFLKWKLCVQAQRDEVLRLPVEDPEEVGQRLLVGPAAGHVGAPDAQVEVCAALALLQRVGLELLGPEQARGPRLRVGRVCEEALTRAERQQARSVPRSR